MKRVILLFAFVIQLFAVGCEKEHEEDFRVREGREKVIITASIEDDANTKLQLEENIGENGVRDGISISWQNNVDGYTDSFTLYDLGGRYVDDFIYVGVTGEKSGNFEQVGTADIISGEKYTAVFPAVKPVDGVYPDLDERNNEKTEFLTVSDASSLKHLNQSVKMKTLRFIYNESSIPNIQFKHETMVLDLNIKHESDRYITNVEFSYGMSINKADILSQEYGELNTFLVAVPVSNSVFDFTLTFDNNTYKTFTVGVNRTYQAGYVYNATIEQDELTDYNPIKIGSRADLEKIGNDANYPLSGHYVMTQDIDMGSTPFKSIASSGSNHFTGSFDGAGYSIDNLVMNGGSLFGHLFDATIKNLLIVNPSLSNSSGGIASILYSESLVYRCAVIGGHIEGDYVGGVVGIINGTKSTVNNCYSTSDIICNEKGGGVVSHSNGVICNCYFAGTITGSGEFKGVVSGENSIYSYYLSPTVIGESSAEHLTSYSVLVAGLRDYYNTYTVTDLLPSLFDEEVYYNNNSEDVILIANEEDLKRISKYANSATYKLSKRIEIKSINWQPITFKGTFDGDDYSISGLNIDSEGNSVGLFGELKDATIKNLHLRAPSVKGGDIVGALVGKGSNLTISRCAVTGGEVVAKSGDGKAGGLFGELHNSTVTSCYNTSWVKSTSTIDYNLGGLVGYGSNNTITHCYSAGSFTRNFINGDMNAIEGYSNGSNISSCFYLSDTAYGNQGEHLTTVESIKTKVDNSELQGFVCLNLNDALPALTTEYVKYTPPVNETIGGYIEINSISDFLAIMNNPSGVYRLKTDIDLADQSWSLPIFKGSLDGEGHIIEGLVVDSDSDNLGLFGELDNAEVKNLLIKKPSVKGQNNVGALAGAAKNSTKISNCGVMEGEIVAKGGYGTVGGIVGYLENSSITSSYNSASVTMDNSLSSLDSNVGGVAGAVRGGVIASCYNAGILANKHNGSKIGGIVSLNENTNVSHSYYISATDLGSVSGVTRKVSAEELNQVVTSGEGLSGFSSGSGTEFRLPYLFNEVVLYGVAVEINSVDGLKAINNNTLGSYILTDNIDLSGENWVSLNTFYGILDGNGHHISNLKIDNTLSDQGLFSKVDGGEIKGLIIKNPSVKGLNNIGALAGVVTNGSKISQCAVIGGDIVAKGSYGTVGSLVAVAEGSSTITSCYNTSSASSLSTEGANVGGVAGVLRDGAVMDMCYNIGNVSRAINGGGIGGLVGTTDINSITNSYYFADIYLVNSGEERLLSLSDINAKINDGTLSNFTVGSGNNIPYLHNSVTESTSFRTPTVVHNYIEISDETGLNDMRNGLSKQYILTSDVTITETNWNPIGGAYNVSKPETMFSGVLNGNGYRIKNLAINAYGQDVNAGLFNTLFSAKVANLIIDAPSVVVGNFGGAIVAHTIEYGSVVKNCATIGGTISSGSQGSQQDFASIVKDIDNYGRKSSIVESCYSTTTISSSSYYESEQLAGIVFSVGKSGIVRNCYFAGKFDIKYPNYVKHAGVVHTKSSDSLVESSFYLNVSDAPITMTGVSRVATLQLLNEKIEQGALKVFRVGDSPRLPYLFNEVVNYTSVE